MENIPDFIYLRDAIGFNEKPMHICGSDYPYAVIYHADHIVQQLKADKAELVEVLNLAVYGECKFISLHAPTDAKKEYAEKILQKHKGEL